MNTEELNRDLTAEQQALDDVLAPLTDEQWSLQTPSPRWSVADQVAHLTYFDRAAVTAMGDPDALTAEVEALIGALGTGSAADSAEAMDRHTLEQYRVLTPAELLATWRRGRSQLSDAAMSLDDGDRVPWFGPSMSSRSFLTARLMEVWAHGQDVCDAVGVAREPTARLAHIAFGVSHPGLVVCQPGHGCSGDRTAGSTRWPWWRAVDLRTRACRPAGHR